MGPFEVEVTHSWKYNEDRVGERVTLLVRISQGSCWQMEEKLGLSLSLPDVLS